MKFVENIIKHVQQWKIMQHLMANMTCMLHVCYWTIVVPRISVESSPNHIDYMHLWYQPPIPRVRFAGNDNSHSSLPPRYKSIPPSPATLSRCALSFPPFSISPFTSYTSFLLPVVRSLFSPLSTVYFPPLPASPFRLFPYPYPFPFPHFLTVKINRRIEYKMHYSLTKQFVR